MTRLLAIAMVSLVAATGSLFAARTVTAGGGCHAEPGGEGSGDAVSIEFCRFAPSVLHVEPGTDVTFTNKEGLPHTVTGADWGDTKYLEVGQSATYSFPEEGTYAFSCVLHPGMVGAVVVGDGSGGHAASVKAVAPGDGDSSNLGLWSLLTVGALTGMVATGAAGLALGRRR
jgi:plastocyanin